MRYKHIAVILLCMVVCSTVFAQRRNRNREDTRSPKQELVYENKAYLPAIRTVQLLPNGEEGILPIIDLDAGDRLDISFDDLRGDVRNYYYSIEHCDMDWQPSRLSVLDYAKGFNEDRITAFETSQSSTQAYTHYGFSIPSEYVSPKTPGNYLLKVYEDADKSRLIITQRFYVVRNLIQVAATSQNSMITTNRNTHQKINVSLKTGLTINNPNRDLHVVVMQNRRPDHQMVVNAPMFAGNGTFTYNNSQTLDFQGNNEYRFVDLRTLRSPSTNVQNIHIDSIVYVTVMTDQNNSTSTYASTFDENGAFYIRNMDFDEDARYTSDYADVTFSLNAPQHINGRIYVVGDFNKYERTEENELSYNADSKTWTTTIKLKQGLYDYDYVLVMPDDKVDITAFSGSHFATGNEYQILIYHRRMGSYWDELLGVAKIGVNNRQ